MYFVINCILGNKNYYVKQVSEGVYEGCLIINYAAGFGSFREIDERTRITITNDMLLERVQFNKESRYKWFIVGKVVNMKDSSIKFIV